jgi:hypothetical protein
VLLEQFKQIVREAPDPRKIDPLDAVDLAVGLIRKARTIEVVSDHVDKFFKCVRCGELIEGDPVFVKERAYHEVHAPKVVKEGPILGPIAEAKQITPREG